MMSTKTPIGTKLFSWRDERFHVSPLIDFMKHKSVPLHRGTIWYYMGGVALFLFLVQVATGILLVLYYRADESSAYESIRFIMTKVEFGWLIRSVHSWSANLMVFFVFVHMFSVFFTRAYQKPRELTWLTGVVLLALTMGFGFTGYLLPWNTLAFFATKVGTDIVGVVPFVGDLAKAVLRGSEDVTGATLSRFFAIHIAIIPAIFGIFLGLHLLLIQRQGMHEPESIANLPPAKKRLLPFFPNFLLRDTVVWLVVLNVLLFLAVFFPWELGEKADPFTSAPAGIRPEWYFLFMFQTLKLIPAHVGFIEGELLGITLIGLGGLAWALLPFWAINGKRGGGSHVMTVIGAVVIGFIVVMTLLGLLT